jgi:RNA polymerase sigma-70 factor (sigma-E family)
VEPIAGSRRLSGVIGTVLLMSSAQTANDRLDALYREHTPSALRLAYLLTGNKALAEDVVHDAFIKVASRIRELRDPEAFRAYFHRAVVNHVRSAGRRKSVADRYIERAAGDPLRSDHDTIPDTDTAEMLWTALQQLPARQREVIVCRYYLDLSERETADALRCPPGTVKSSLSRGLDALRDALQGGDR